MLRWLKGLIPVVSLGCFVLAPGQASADSVTFHTVVVFTNPGSFDPGSTAASLVKGTDILAVSGETQTVSFDLVTPPTSTNFGQFTPFALSTQNFSGAKIKISIFQDATVPVSGAVIAPGTFVGSVSGQILVVPSSDTLHLTFSGPLSFVLPSGSTGFPPGVEYSVPNLESINLAEGFQITGFVDELPAAPLPSTASMGFGLLGGLGCLTGVNVLRRRRMA
jgi:hypothetical protein